MACITSAKPPGTRVPRARGSTLPLAVDVRGELQPSIPSHLDMTKLRKLPSRYATLIECLLSGRSLGLRLNFPSYWHATCLHTLKMDRSGVRFASGIVKLCISLAVFTFFKDIRTTSPTCLHQYPTLESFTFSLTYLDMHNHREYCHLYCRPEFSHLPMYLSQYIISSDL
jgi:hypothetical protein